MGHGAPGDTSGSGGTPVNQALDSVLGMALQMPAMQALGKELGISLENGLAGVANGAIGISEAKEPSIPSADAIEEEAVKS
ncbi:flotillin domain-containing protein [Roseobacter litoralis]